MVRACTEFCFCFSAWIHILFQIVHYIQCLNEQFLYPVCIAGLNSCIASSRRSAQGPGEVLQLRSRSAARARHHDTTQEATAQIVMAEYGQDADETVPPVNSECLCDVSSACGSKEPQLLMLSSVVGS